MKRKPKVIPLIHPDGSQEDAMFEWWKQKERYFVQITANGLVSTLESDQNYFEAYCKAKAVFEADGSKFDQQKSLNLIFDWDRKSKKLPILLPNRSKSIAEVKWWKKASSKDHWGQCYVSIKVGDRRSKGKQSDFFDALEEARLPFEKDGYRLLCYGASLNVFPSGMGRSCTSGKEAYQFNLKNIKKTKGSKFIFDTGKDIVPATVKEQRTFFQKWMSKDEAEGDIEYDDGFFQWPIEPYFESSNK